MCLRSQDYTSFIAKLLKKDRSEGTAILKKLIILVLALPILFYMGAKGILHYRVGQMVDTLATQVSPAATLSYDSVTSSLTGEVGITGLVIKPHDLADDLTVDKVALEFPSALFLWNAEEYAQAGTMPEEFALHIEGMRMNTNGALLRMLEEAGASAKPVVQENNCVTEVINDLSKHADLGINTLTFDMEMGYALDTANNEYRLHGSIDEHQTMAVNYSFALPMISANTTSMARSLADPAVIRAELNIVDQGYYERLYNYCENQEGLSAEMTKTLVVNNMVTQMTTMGFVPDQQIISDFKRFLDNQQSFVISAEPHTPQALSQLSLYAPEDMPNVFNIHTEAI